MSIHIGRRTFDGYPGQMIDDDLIKAAQDALKRPSEAAFWDDDLYVTHTLMFYSAPDSDDLIAQSNHARILEDLSAEFPDDVEAASIGHWTYSRYDCIKVRVIRKGGAIHPAFVAAYSIALELRDYPLYDEQDYSDREMAEWDRAIEDEVLLYAAPDDDDEIRNMAIDWLHGDSAQLIGYHEVGYVPDETVEAALTTARELIAAARALGFNVPNTSGEPIF